MKNTAGLHGLKRVLDHIIKGLLHLVAIDLQSRQSRVEIQLDDDVTIADFRSQEGDGFLENLVQIMSFKLRSRGTYRSQELVDDRVEPLDFAFGCSKQFADVTPQLRRSLPQSAFNKLQDGYSGS